MEFNSKYSKLKIRKQKYAKYLLEFKFVIQIEVNNELRFNIYDVFKETQFVLCDNLTL